MIENAIPTRAAAVITRSALLIGCAFSLMIASPSSGAATIDLTRYVALFAPGTDRSMETCLWQNFFFYR